MAASNTETLQIDIKVNDNGAAGKIDAVTTAVNGLATAVNGAHLDKLTNIADGLKSLAQSANALSKISQPFAGITQSISDLQTALKSFKLKDVSGNLSGMKTALESSADAFKPISNVANSLKRLNDLSKMPEFRQNLEKVASDVAAFVKKLTDSISDDVLNKFERLSNALAQIKGSGGMGSIGGGKQGGMSGLISGAQLARMYLSNLKGEMKTIIKLGSQLASLPFKMLLEPMKGFAGIIGSIGSRLKGLLARIGRVAMTRAIRGAIKAVTQAIKEGTTALYEWAGVAGNSFKGTMDSIATSTNYLRNSFAAMISPLLDAVAPALDYIIDKCVDVINVFNQLIAILTGAGTWRKAEKVATGYGKAASGAAGSTGDANKAAKELKRTLLGFDEINRLDDADKSSGSGGGGGGGGGSGSGSTGLEFSEQQITSSVQDMATQLKEAWEKADFTEIGSAIGEKIGGAMLKVPWATKIQPTVSKLAKSFGTLLNGMFGYSNSGGKKMWDGIAYTIYNAINTAVLGYVTFFETVNWKDIGAGVGAALKTALLEGINWDLIAEGLAEFPNAVIDAIDGFCDQFTLSDFREAGEKIGGTFADALVNIHWDTLFSDGMRLAQGILRAINGALESFGENWGDIKEGILDGIDKIPSARWEDLGKQIGRAIVNVVEFVANIVDVIVSAIKEGDWDTLFDGIKEGIGEKVQELGGWSGVAKDLGSWISENLDAVGIFLAFSLAGTTLQFGKTLLKAALLESALAGKGIASTTLGAFLKAIPVVGGIALALHGMKVAVDSTFEKIDIGKKIRTAMKGTVESGIGGALIGFGLASKLGITGLAAGAFGFSIASGIALSFSALKTMWDDLKGGDAESFASELVAGIAGSALGAAVGLVAGPAGAFVGGLIGFGIGAHLSIIFEEFDFGYEGITGNWWTDWYEGSLAQGVVNGAGDLLGLLGLGPETVYADEVPGGNTAQKRTIKFEISPDISTSNTWWTDVQTAWEGIVSSRKAMRFHVMGVVNDAKDWWDQLQVFWKGGIEDRKASRFHVMGVVNESAAWWTQLTTFWNTQTDRKKASRFHIGGVHNESAAWWSQLETYWNTQANKKTLHAGVTLTGLWGAFVDAWNTLQGYFNRYALTATVNVKTGKVPSGATYQADGGVYSHGRWHDIRRYAAGGLPMSGEMYIAREAGPELVGTLNGSTAVVNNDQIISSIADGVYRATLAAMGTQNQNPTNDITLKLDSEVLYRAVRKGERVANGRYATVVTVGG